MLSHVIEKRIRRLKFLCNLVVCRPASYKIDECRLLHSQFA